MKNKDESKEKVNYSSLSFEQTITYVENTLNCGREVAIRSILEKIMEGKLHPRNKITGEHYDPNVTRKGKLET